MHPEAKDPSGAMDTFERELRRAASLLEEGRLEQAYTWAAEALGLRPAHLLAQNLLGLILYQQHRFPAALEIFESLVRRNPDVASLRMNAGLAALHGGDAEGALEHLRRAVDLEPGYPRAFTALALAHLRRDEAHLAVAALLEAGLQALAARLGAATTPKEMQRLEAELRARAEAEPLAADSPSPCEGFAEVTALASLEEWRKEDLAAAPQTPLVPLAGTPEAVSAEPSEPAELSDADPEPAPAQELSEEERWVEEALKVESPEELALVDEPRAEVALDSELEEPSGLEEPPVQVAGETPSAAEAEQLTASTGTGPTAPADDEDSTFQLDAEPPPLPRPRRRDREPPILPAVSGVIEVKRPSRVHEPLARTPSVVTEPMSFEPEPAQPEPAQPEPAEPEPAEPEPAELQVEGAAPVEPSPPEPSLEDAAQDEAWAEEPLEPLPLDPAPAAPAVEELSVEPLAAAPAEPDLEPPPASSESELIGPAEPSPDLLEIGPAELPSFADSEPAASGALPGERRSSTRPHRRLAERLAALALPELEAGLEAALRHGILILRLLAEGPGALVRRSGLLLQVGELDWRPARRRRKGGEAEAFVVDGQALELVSGRGLLALRGAEPGHLELLHLNRDGIYIQESLLLAASAELRWENGRLPGLGDREPRLVRLRGSGYLALACQERPFTVLVPEQELVKVQLQNLLGWTGSAVPRFDPESDLVSFSGAGVLLVQLGAGESRGP